LLNEVWNNLATRDEGSRTKITAVITSFCALRPEVFELELEPEIAAIVSGL